MSFTDRLLEIGWFSTVPLPLFAEWTIPFLSIVLDGGCGLGLLTKLFGAWWSVFWSDSPGFGCWISFAPAFQCWSCCWVLILFHLSNERLLFWFIDELQVLHVDRITCMYMNHSRTQGEGCVRVKTGLSPPVIYYWPFQCGSSVVVYSNCQCPSAFCWSLTYCSSYLR